MKRSQMKQWLAVLTLASAALTTGGCGNNPTASGTAVAPGQTWNPNGTYGVPGAPGQCSSLLGPIAFSGQNTILTGQSIAGYAQATGTGAFNNIPNYGSGSTTLSMERGISDGLLSIYGAIQIVVSNQSQFTGNYSYYPYNQQAFPQYPNTSFPNYAIPPTTSQWPYQMPGGVVMSGVLQLSQYSLSLLQQQGVNPQSMCVSAMSINMGHVLYGQQRVLWGQVQLQTNYGQVLNLPF